MIFDICRCSKFFQRSLGINFVNEEKDLKGNNIGKKFSKYFQRSLGINFLNEEKDLKGNKIGKKFAKWKKS